MLDKLTDINVDALGKWVVVLGAAWGTLKYVLSPLTALRRLEAAVARIERTLHGEDGRPGLVGKVDTLHAERNEERERELEGLREQVEEYRRRDRNR